MTVQSHRPRLRRALGAAATLAAVAALSTACGDSDEKGDDTGSESSQSESQGLSEEQANEAVLTVDNLGSGWAEDADDDDDEDSPGCLGEVDEVTEKVDEEVEVDVSYSYNDDLPSVSSGVSAYADEDEIADVFDEFEDAIQECTSVTFEEEGITYNLTIAPVTDASGIEVDDQNGFVASGEITTAEGQKAPLYILATYFRVGANVGTVSTVAFEDLTANHNEYVKIAADRLAAVAEGEEPEDTTAPAV